MFTAPTVDQFKARFVRDFNYAPADDPNNLDFITANEVQNAINLALVDFNADLFDSNAGAVFFWLAAFYLVWGLQISTKGVASQSNFPVSGRNAGGLGVSYSVPDVYMKNAAISKYTQNGYGMMYLSFALPATIGNVGVVEGTTTSGY